MVEWVETTHELITNTVAIMVAIHIEATLCLSYRLKENLPLSIITGKRNP